MSKRSLVMLAKDYDPLKFKLAGGYVSEKLDGMRAIWLPFTRGLNFKAVPWANTAKDDRNPQCSGLWSRRGKNIAAPVWFLDQLPQKTPLDGELFLGRGLFTKTMSVVRKLQPVDAEWEGVVYNVFDIPNYEEFFRPGTVREGGRAGEPAYEVYFKASWPDEMFSGGYLRNNPYWKPRRFNEAYAHLKTVAEGCPGENWKWVFQDQLPFTDAEATAKVAALLEVVTDAGGEGLMVRRPHSIWETPVRSAEITKVKKLLDAEAEVVGYVYGLGKYKGMVGAFRVKWKGVTFDLSGFTDREREVKFDFQAEASDNEGKPTNNNVAKHFPLGTTITFRYNDLSPDGIPRFARYWRKYEV